MAFDTLVKEAESMTEDQVMQLLTFARFLKSEAQSRKKTTETSSQKHRRTPGGMPYGWQMILMKHRTALRSICDVFTGYPYFSLVHL